jgi:hypothetical protein
MTITREDYNRAAGTEHQITDTTVEPLDHAPVRATLVVVGMALACLIGGFAALGFIR